MKKLILFVCILSVLLISGLPAWAAEEQWSNGIGVFKAQREGNSISLIPINPRRARAAGIPVLVGAITGTTFTGKVYLFADECPSLDGYVSASGTVSADGSSIKVTNKMTNYSPTKCTVNYTYDDSITFTKMNSQNSPSVSPQPSLPLSPTPTETPLDLNGTWTTVNGKGTAFTMSGRHTGNNLSLLITDVSDDLIKDTIGKISLSGTLLGHAFKGTGILIPYAPECLGKYFTTDATGTVAADGLSIAVSYTNFRYRVSTCTKVPGSEFTDTITYNKVNKEKKPTSADKTKQVSPSPEITKIVEEPSVGVSSKDFRELARANAEYQKAKAELEEIKNANDPRYDAKKDFLDEYNSKLDEVASQIAQEQKQDKEEVKDNLKILRTDLERVRDALSSYSDIKDVRDVLKAGKSGSYGGVSLASDLIGGATDFVDLIGEDVSVDNAATKVGIDTVVPNALYTIPILKAADTVLNVPDKIANAFGVGEDNWYRKNSTGFLKEHSISGFVKLTTKAMIKTGSWTNVNGAFQVAWGDVKEAEGIGEKVLATLDLVGTAVGAVPVAAALGIRDTVFVGGKVAVDYVSSWFTWPN